MSDVAPLPTAPVSWRYRLGGLLPGAIARRVQVIAYSEEWEADNRLAGQASGPLWVALGDSATQAIGAATRDGGYALRVLAELRRRDPDWRLINLSRTGARIADVLADQLPVLAELSAASPPALVTLAVGINDLRHRTRELHSAFAELLDRLPPGAVVANLPRGMRESQATRVNDFLDVEIARRGFVIADLWSHTGPPWRGKFSADHFHPNDVGYASWTAAFLEALPG